MLFAWIVILRETADFIAMQSRKIPVEFHGDHYLGSALLTVEDAAPALFPPRIVSQWEEIVRVAQGTTYPLQNHG